MLNNRARDILAFVQRCSRDRGLPPTIREIGKHFGIASTNGVRYYLNLLEKEGHLKRSGRISRGISAVSSGRREASIPILGRVAAGQPIVADECFEGALELEQMFGDPQGMFALRVRGDSMIEAGILEGDYVVVRSQPQANAGEIVVALLSDEATVKYYQPRRGRTELVAANPKYQPIVIEGPAELRILGVVKGVLRTLVR